MFIITCVAVLSLSATVAAWCPSSDPCCMPMWGEWSSWGDCSESCNRGERSRYRDCQPAGCYCPGSSTEYEECIPECDSLFMNDEFANLTVTASSNANSANDALIGTGSYWNPKSKDIAYWRAYLPKDSCCQIVSISFEFRYSAGIHVSEKQYGVNNFSPVTNIPSPPNEPDDVWKQSGVVYFSEGARKIELEVSPSSLRGPKPCLRNVNITICCPSDCSAELDIAFVIDGSGSVRPFWHDLLNIVTSLVDQFSIGPIRVAAVQFDHNANTEFFLNQFDDKEVLKGEIAGMGQFGGGTNIGSGLNVAREQIFIEANGARESAPNIVILLTDGFTADEAFAIAEADMLKSDGTTIVAIGIGNADIGQLNDIASEPINEHVFTGADTDEILQKLDEILESVCSQ